MKKTLLFAAALAASLGAYAQDLVVFNTDNSSLSDIESKYTEHTDSKGKAYNAADFAEETVIGDCDAFTVYLLHRLGRLRAITLSLSTALWMSPRAVFRATPTLMFQ